MSIKRCIASMPEVKTVGVAGILSSDGFQSYRRCSGADSLCFSFPDESVHDIIRGDITTATQNRLCVAMTEQIRRFKRQSPWMQVTTFATPALELLSSGELSEFGLKLFSLNEVIAKHCVKNGIRRPALFGTEWDTSSDGPLVQTLAAHGIEALVPEGRQMRHLMTACAFNGMRGYINCGGPLKEANDFCVDVANRMLFESASTLDAFIICNVELRPFMPRLRQCLRGSNAAIPIINASELHFAALSARTFENPPS